MTYSGSEIIIDIIIKTSGNDEEKVIEKLKIDVEFNGNKDYVEAKTVFCAKNSYSWMSYSNPQVKLNAN